MLSTKAYTPKQAADMLGLDEDLYKKEQEDRKNLSRVKKELSSVRKSL